MLPTKTIIISISALAATLLLIWWVFLPIPTTVPAPASPVPLSSSSFSPVSPCPDFSAGEVTINDTVFAVGFADSREAKAKGLSGCPELPPQSGLVFPFEPARAVSFWMKDMLIPIDIIWIKDERIIGIERNVPVPSDPQDQASLPIYQPPGPVDTVLEIAAGRAANQNLQIGDRVTIQAQ